VKITFEGKTMEDLIDEMRSVIAASHEYRKIAETRSETPAPVQEAIVPEAIAPVDEPVEVPVEKPVDKMAKVRAAKKAKAKPAPEHPQEPFSDPAERVVLRRQRPQHREQGFEERHVDDLAAGAMHVAVIQREHDRVDGV